MRGGLGAILLLFLSACMVPQSATDCGEWDANYIVIDGPPGVNNTGRPLLLNQGDDATLTASWFCQQPPDEVAWYVTEAHGAQGGLPRYNVTSTGPTGAITFPHVGLYAVHAEPRLEGRAPLAPFEFPGLQVQVNIVEQEQTLVTDHYRIEYSAFCCSGNWWNIETSAPMQWNMLVRNGNGIFVHQEIQTGSSIQGQINGDAYRERFGEEFIHDFSFELHPAAPTQATISACIVGGEISKFASRGGGQDYDIDVCPHDAV